MIAPIRTLAATIIAGLGLGAAPLAAQAPELTVYTYSSFSGEYGPGGRIKAAFEAECGCTLTWVETEDSGTLVARLKLEGASTEADIVLGLDTGFTSDARASGLFEPHGIDLSGLAMPVPWTDDTFVPFDWGWFAFVYDSTRQAVPPQSFRELVEDEDGPTLVIQDPRTSSPGLGLLLWVQQLYGIRSSEVWAKLKPRIVTVTKGWSEAYGLFLEGEADMVLSYTTSPAYHIGVEGVDRYKAAIFPEGHYMQVEVAGLVASSAEKDLARQFLQFIVSDGFQAAIPEGNWMYPVTEPEGGLPVSYSSLGAPEKSFLMTAEEVEANRRAWIDEWLAAMAP